MLTRKIQKKEYKRKNQNVAEHFTIEVTIEIQNI